MNVQIQRRRYDCSALPKGWKREEVLRKNCLITPGKIDVFYYSPCGKRIRNKPQLVRFLGESVDLSSFDYRTGKINPMLVRKKKCKGTLYDYSRGLRSDSSLVPPIRQTASIFKQPVTVVKTQQHSVVKSDIKHGTQDKPKQVFWEKRLQGLGATCNAKWPVMEELQLPAALRPVGPQVTSQTVLQSLATALHVVSGPITGQTVAAQTLQSNPAVFINPDQPLVEEVHIRDADIISQEALVDKIRTRLERAIRQVANVSH
ncbi:hypothetical protein HAZT_HAZT001888 [Hyalella azteca]|uniref:Methyl-CpG-binding domain protein 2 n=1 Tax=Hyalella azteca TaxID=294128 RepID=A0A6A0HC59_HYAAZ|nr:methyl-CpG-binding domain protein 2 [Hyalella azteca]KAA0203346.1 hypothetical protein HAZT_HAZT001888 [Hyalella azteca]